MGKDNGTVFDFAIVGSGVSGGAIAYELASKGAKCVLLEAGREFNSRTFPENELDYSTQMFWGGGLEVSNDGGIGFLRAKCLGGTSVVNQALLDRFDDIAWDDWRDRSQIGFLNPKDMEVHYTACESKLKISEIPPQHHNRNAKVFIEAFKKNDLGWKPLRRAQDDCKIEKGTDCIGCLGGCRRESKQSSLITTVKWAREKGLHVESEFDVHHLVYGKDRVKIVGHKRGSQTDILAAKVVLAAGAIGNPQILFRSGLAEHLPSLGTRFSCHPQFMTYALFDDLVDAHKGAFQAVKSDDRKLRLMGFKLENVFAPPIGTAMLIPGFGKNHERLMRKYRYMASLEVAIRDEPLGKLSLGKGGKLRIEKKLTSADKDKVKKGLKLVRGLFESVSARKIIECHQIFGLHLMGGCPIGSDSKTSVVNPEFSIHGFGNIFIADSSVFPSAPGINPSFTIMALSHKAAESMIRN